MDFGKYKYDKKKRTGQHSHHTKTKEIRLRPKTGQHDIGFKVKTGDGLPPAQGQSAGVGHLPRPRDGPRRGRPQGDGQA